MNNGAAPTTNRLGDALILFGVSFNLRGCEALGGVVFAMNARAMKRDRLPEKVDAVALCLTLTTVSETFAARITLSLCHTHRTLCAKAARATAALTFMTVTTD